MEQKPENRESEPQPQKKEPIISKSTLVIIGVFLAINIAIIAMFFLKPWLSGEKEAEVAVNASPLEKISLVDLGRLEITKPIDPINQSFMRCSVTVALTVPAERAGYLEPKIKEFEAIFKEIARRAFLDADPRDVSTENLAAVKATIKAKSNAMLGEEAIQDVVFADFRPY